MLRVLGWLLAIAVLFAGGWWLYNHTGSRAVSTSGDVFPRDTSADPPDAKDDSDSTTPADSNPTPIAAAPAPAANTLSPAAQPAMQTSVQTAAQPVVQSTPQPSSDAKPIVGLPVSDSIPRDPPAGMAFGGSGKYQWYRQGDITWRIDTNSGAACIDFATMDQWARRIVYSHGCHRS